MSARLSVPNRLQGHFLDASLRFLENSARESFVYDEAKNSGEFKFGRVLVHYVIRPDVVEAHVPDREGTSLDASIIEDFLRQVFSFEYRSRPFKIFGIGLPRTGTTSLATALKSLGIFTLHYAPWMSVGLSKGIYRCQTTDDFDALTDSPFPLIYEQMDEIYPGSKFILTLRHIEEWLPSIQHLKGDSLPRYRRMYYGVDEYDEEIYRARFLQHRDEVMDYFSGRPDDLLVFDYSSGAGWDCLCSFLNLPVPDRPFPWANSRPRHLR
jgi:hypothetical protein